MVILVFFFQQKTAYDFRISDWSSDVCSSDLRPKATAVESCRHHWVEGAPTVMVREKKSMLVASTIGIRPRMVVTVVSITGRRRWAPVRKIASRSEEHTSELQSLMRISYAVSCLKKKQLLTITCPIKAQHR